MFNNNEKNIIKELVQKAIVTNNFNREAAIQAIDRYLRSKPDEASKKFFEAFRNEIIDQHGGFSYQKLRSKLDTLIQARSQGGYPALFDHWWDAKSSPAARCLQELYTLATGEPLTKKQKQALVDTCELPKKTSEEQTAFYTAQIEKLVSQPLGYPNNLFKQVTLTAYLQKKAEIEEPLLAAQIERAKQQRIAEAKYQQAILAKATAIIAAIPSNQWLFDPQGHVLVEVPPLTQEELDAISTDPTIRAALNVDLNKTTLCNIDILGWQGGKTAFLEWITNSNTSARALPISKKCKEAIDQFIEGPRPLGSVIPLQENMSFHLGLMTRVLQSKTKPGSEQIWANIIQAVTKKLNQDIRLIYRQALIDSYQNGVIDLGLVNTKLDEAQPVLVKECHKLLAQLCVEKLPQQTELLAAVKALKDKDFTQVSATGKDYVRFDAVDQASYRITRTDETAHNKKYGEEQAFRIIHTARYNPEQGTVTALDRDLHCVARVPSIAQLKPDKSKGNFFTRFFKGFIKIFSHKESVTDVAVKLKSAYTTLQGQLGGYDGPMTYNLLTSLHSKAWDFLNPFERGNFQRASAARILYGAHVFNAQQIKDGNPNSLFFVQNIPVNQHTNNLGYDSYDSDGASREATLMADIALLSTLTQHAKLFPERIQKFLEENNFKILQEYRWFLENHSQGNLYFNDTPRANRVMVQLDFIKSQLKPIKFNYDNPTLLELATQALLKLYGSNMHWDKQFGMLVQSLSVFVELASQTGCKSAIDRAKGVLGRNLMLEALDKKPLPLDHPLVQKLQSFVKGELAAEGLQKALDTNYGNTSLDRLPISQEDTGGNAKLKASKNTTGNGKISELSTNIGESPYLQHVLRAKHPGKTQSHKAELPSQFKELFAKSQNARVSYDDMLSNLSNNEEEAQTTSTVDSLPDRDRDRDRDRNRNRDPDTQSLSLGSIRNIPGIDDAANITDYQSPTRPGQS